MTLGLLFTVGIDSEEEVLAILNYQQGLLNGLPPIMENDGKGVTYKREFAIPPYQVIAECKYFLRQINPAVYGQRVTRSRPFFS